MIKCFLLNPEKLFAQPRFVVFEKNTKNEKSQENRENLAKKRTKTADRLPLAI